MLFHLLDVLAHDSKIESEDEATWHMCERKKADGDTYTTRVKNNNYMGREFQIELFGVTETGSQVHVNVTGFCPSFYVELPDAGAFTEIQSVVNKVLKPRCTECTPNLVIEFEKVKRKRLFGYTANHEFPMVKISVNSLDLFRKARKLFLDEKMNPIFHYKTRCLEVYEANLDPLLRFFHTQDIEPCGWVELDVECDDTEESIISCDYTDIKKPTKRPGKSGPALLASWDIECYSPDGDFPVPEKLQYPIIQIGVVLVRTGEAPRRHCFVYSTEKDVCADVPGVVIHRSGSEKDLIADWAAHMIEWSPDIWIGYNIFGFDERYVWKRAELLGCVPAFQGFSRYEDETVKLQEKMLSSSALGDNRLYMWNSAGRLQIDLYHYIKRMEALPSYKLDDVTSHYMSGKLKAIKQDA